MRDVAGFKIDGRSTDLRRNGIVSVHAPQKHDKYRESLDAWRAEFGDAQKPRYATYMQLELRGWKFSSRYGWRKLCK